MSTPKADYPQQSTFGQRIAQLADEKQRIAKHIVDNFLGNGCASFISDGSSTLYVGLAIFQKAQACQGDPFVSHIYTNNLAIAHEYPLWDSPRGTLPAIRVYIAPGVVESDLTMVRGDRANQHAKDSSATAQFAVLSVRAIFGDYGPAGREPGSLQIKQHALHLAQKVILVADHEKLSTPFTLSAPLVYPITADWGTAMANPNYYVVSTTHPDVNYPEEVLARPPQDPQTPADWYLRNRWRIEHAMNQDGRPKRFIEV